MPTRRELREQEQRAQQRTEQARNDQVANGGGTPPDGGGPRGGGNLGGNGKGLTADDPLWVGVATGHSDFYTGLLKAFRDQLHEQSGAGHPSPAQAVNQVNLKSFEAINQAANQIAYELRGAVQAIRDQRSGLDTSLDGLQDAIDDFVNQQKGRHPQGPTTAGQQPMPPAPPPPAGTGTGPTTGQQNTPQTPSGPGTRPAPKPKVQDPYGQQMRSIDPQGRLGGALIGGEDYWRLMARGEDPTQGVEPGRSHPVNTHELRHIMGTQLGRAIHNRYGLGHASVPKLNPQHDDDGNLTHYEFHDGTGGAPQQIAPDDDAGLSTARTAVQGAMVGRRAVGSKIGASVASGAAHAGARGALMGVARAVPGVGTALTIGEAANAAAKEGTEQRSKNAFYQSIYGGSNASAFGDRIGEERTVLAQRFSLGMDEEMARKSYRDVSGLGYDGDKRDKYVQFIGQNYNKTGMNEGQSMGILTAATRTANEGLVGVASSLEVVTKRARTMGVNVSQMTDAFVKNYAAIAEMGGGAGSGPAAAGAVARTEGLGKGFEGADASGMFSTSSMRIMGGQGGRTLGQQISRMRDDPVGFGRDQDTRVNQVVGNTLHQGKFAEKVQAAVAARGGVEAVSKNPQLLREIWHDMESDPDAPDPQVLQQMFGAAGLHYNDVDDAGAAGISQIVNPNNSEDSAKQAQQQAKVRPLTDDEKAQKPGQWDLTGSKPGRNGQQRAWYDVFGKISDDVKDLTQGESGNEAARSLEDETGNKNPVFDQVNAVTQGNDNVGVSVQTAKGEQTVDMATAMRDYGDQVSRGTARFVGGEHDGQKIKDVEGVTVDPSAQGDSSKKDPGDKGVTADKWKTDHPDDKTAGNSSVTLDLTDPAKRLVKQLDPEGDSDSESAASVGSAPQPGVPKLTPPRK